MTPEIEEEVLTSLGLTSSQARVYLALVYNGPSKVMLISQASKIHRTHIYQILRSLEDAGFVERKLGTGTYTAIPFKEVAPILVKNKKREISKLETEINEVIDSLPKKTSVLKDKSEVLLITNKNHTLNKGQKCFEAASSQIELMHTWKRFVQLWQYYETTLANAMARGVMIRQIVEYPKDEIKAQKFLNEKVFKNSLFEIRFVCETGGNFVIIDKGMLLVSTSQDKENLAETPFLFSNYEGFLGIMQRYFLLSWKNACNLTMLNKNSEKLCKDQNTIERNQSVPNKPAKVK